MVQLFALEVDLRAAEVLGQALGEVQRARATDVVALEVGQLLLEFRIVLGLFIFAGQVVDQRHQGFGDVLPAEAAEEALGIGAGAQRGHAGLLFLHPSRFGEGLGKRVDGAILPLAR
ncbi:hypothetical protein D9M71_65580 [compost metagenome]